MAHCTHAQGPASCKSPTCPGRQEYMRMLKTGKRNPTVFEEEHATDFTIAEYFKDDYIPNAPEELTELAYSFMDYTEEIEVTNHNKTGPEMVTLMDMLENNKLFNNNCGPVTWAILNDLENESISGYSFTEHVVQYKEGVHVAVLATSEEGEEYVIDFTAKQYYNRLPCPLVEKRENWEKTIDTYVSMLFSDERKTS